MWRYKLVQFWYKLAVDFLLTEECRYVGPPKHLEREQLDREKLKDKLSALHIWNATLGGTYQVHVFMICLNYWMMIFLVIVNICLIHFSSFWFTNPYTFQCFYLQPSLILFLVILGCDRYTAEWCILILVSTSNVVLLFILLGSVHTVVYY